MISKRRQFVRIKTDLPVTINDALQGKIVDLSESGVQIVCNQSAAFDILPADQHTPGPVYNVDLDLKFTLGDMTEKVVNCCSRIVFLSRLSQDKYQFGCKLLKLDESNGQIRDYILESRTG